MLHRADFIGRLSTPAEAASLAVSLTAIQQIAFLVASATLILVFAARLINAEANVRRMGLFLHIFVDVPVLALFGVVASQTDLTLFKGVVR